MVYADRYTGWVEVALMTSGRAKTVCDTLRTWFCTYGVPEEISSDGGPPFESQEYDSFLRNWGIRKRTSSAHYAQGNGRAELAVKTARRILADNTDSYGRLCHDRAARPLLTHGNTPVQDLDMSPAMMLYGRVIKDHLPVLRDKYQVRKQWTEIGKLREVAMAKRHMRNEQYYNQHCRPLRELQVGDYVQIQNQDGNHPRRWTKTGRIVETQGYRQYQVRVDGSNRVTLRNRRFLHRIHPVVDGPRNIRQEIPNPPINVETPQAQPPEEAMEVEQHADTESPSEHEEEMEVEDTTGGDTQKYSPPPLREPSSRRTRAPRGLSPQMRGKSHEYFST